MQDTTDLADLAHHLTHHTGLPLRRESAAEAARTHLDEVEAAWRACWAEAYASLAATGTRHCSYGDQPMVELWDWLHAHGRTPGPGADGRWDTTTPPGGKGPDPTHMDAQAAALVHNFADTADDHPEAAIAALIQTAEPIGLARVTRALRTNPRTAQMIRTGLLRLQGALGRN